MRLAKYFYPVLLALALLFAQQGGVMHALHHVIEEQTQDHSLPHDKLCDLCAVYAQIGSAIGSNHVIFNPSEQIDTFYSPIFSGFHFESFAAFAARAPPYSV